MNEITNLITAVCSMRRYHITAGMQAGMVVSNEPGYYEEGAFGIRIENLVAAQEAETPFKFGDVPYLSFERLTLVPFQRKLMDVQVCLSSITSVLFESVASPLLLDPNVDGFPPNGALSSRIRAEVHAHQRGMQSAL